MMTVWMFLALWKLLSGVAGMPTRDGDSQCDHEIHQGEAYGRSDVERVSTEFLAEGRGHEGDDRKTEAVCG